MMQQTIEVIVSPQGETRIETKGFAGSACQQASRFLEEALGAKTNERLTAEYYRQPLTEVQRVAQKGGAS